MCKYIIYILLFILLQAPILKAQQNIYQTSDGNVGIGTPTPTYKLTVNGAVQANRYLGENLLQLATFRTAQPQSNIYLYSPLNDRDAWIYLDQADPNSNWGIYHRQIDSTIEGLPGNSIGFIGGGLSELNAYISLTGGSAYFRGNMGIGAIAPTAKLQVMGKIKLGDLNEDMGAIPNIERAIHFYSKGANYDSPTIAHTGGRIYSTNTEADLHTGMNGGWNAQALVMEAGCAWEDGSTSDKGFHKWQMVLLGNGHVGINTPAPDALLTIQGDGSAPLALNVGGNSNGKIRVRHIDGKSPATSEIEALYLQWQTDFPTIINGTGGNVGIGTPNPTHKLTVNGTIRTKEIIVDTGWADDVFSPSYKLASLSDVKEHIIKNGHLPDIPSAIQVATQGVNIGETQSLLLRKIEELTLHLIQQQEQIAIQNQKIEKLENEVSRLRQ